MAYFSRRKAIILGLSGVGKSKLGNALIGTEVFRVGKGFNAVTLHCQRAENDKIIVIDTPGFFDSQHFIAETSIEVKSALIICPNPHAFLIVFRGDIRFTRENLRLIDILRFTYDEVCFSHSICVFTGVEDTMSDEEFRRNCDENKALRSFIQNCGGRVARFNAKGTGLYAGIAEIYRLVDDVSKNGKISYDNDVNHNLCVLQRRQQQNEQLQINDPNYRPDERETGSEELQAIAVDSIPRNLENENEQRGVLAQICLALLCSVVGANLGVYLILSGNLEEGFKVIVIGTKMATSLPVIRRNIMDTLQNWPRLQELVIGHLRIEEG